MCLAIPGEVLELRREKSLLFGKVRFGGVTRMICLEYVPDVQPGEFVLVHVGFAISKIDAESAARAYAVLEDLGETLELTKGGEEST